MIFLSDRHNDLCTGQLLSWFKRPIGSFLFLLTILLFVYFDPVQTSYYFADEKVYFTKFFTTEKIIPRLWQESLIHGRPVTIFLYSLMADTESASNGLRYIRFLQLIKSAGYAWIFFWLIFKKIGLFASYLLTFFIWFQPTMFVYHAYAMLTPYIIGGLCSYLAFILIYNRKSKHVLHGALKVIGALFLLETAFLIFQASPFASLGMIGLYALMTPDVADKRIWFNYWMFLIILAAASVIYFFVYRYLVNNYPDLPTYELTAQSFELIASPIMILKYLTNLDIYRIIFEWWNYPLPVPIIAKDLYRIATSFFMSIWAMLLIISFVLDFLKTRLSVKKYGIAILCLLFTMLPIILEGGSSRQHIYIASTPAFIIIGGYAFKNIIGYIPFSYSVWKYAAVMLTVFVGFGARTVLYRNLIYPSSRFLTYTKQEIEKQRKKEPMKSLSLLYPRYVILNRAVVF